ncbi:AGAP004349-PA-like protein [Anopheles sinensis]|uniref:AGAP004349-PA-like protein n=1 Tax=Anopheles sinensis TaxID=74873 RepID=A0A084WQ84_ANOSI|nr:AGAP004349-PA-like protein [Anopheles sinensis]
MPTSKSHQCACDKLRPAVCKREREIERGGRRIDPATAKTEVFEVEADKVKFIIGRGGNKIREIQDRCRVSVQIDKARNENGANNVSVMGDQLNIDRARDMINTIINDDRRDREDDRRREGNGLAF